MFPHEKSASEEKKREKGEFIYKKICMYGLYTSIE